MGEAGRLFYVSAYARRKISADCKTGWTFEIEVTGFEGVAPTFGDSWGVHEEFLSGHSTCRTRPCSACCFTGADDLAGSAVKI